MADAVEAEVVHDAPAAPTVAANPEQAAGPAVKKIDFAAHDPVVDELAQQTFTITLNGGAGLHDDNATWEQLGVAPAH